MPFQGNYREISQRLINGAGVDCTYVKSSFSTYDPNTSSVIKTDSTPLKFKGYVSKLSYSESKDPALVGSQAEVLMVAYNDLPEAPQVSASLTFLGNTTEVLKYTAISYGAGVAFWRIITKRA